MGPIRESLAQAVSKLSENDAHRAIARVPPPQGNSELGRVGARLAGHRAITPPAVDTIVFRDLEPIQGEGIPASEFLARDGR